MKFFQKMALTAILCCNFSGSLWAQAQSLQSTLQKIQDAYTRASYLRFVAKYTYATEQHPEIVLDSAVGTYQLTGKNYWSCIDSTETVVSEDLLIVAYHKQKQLYIDKPRSADVPSALGALDSLFKHTSRYELKSEGDNKVILEFKEDALYQRATLEYDPKTFLIQKISYLLSPVSEENPDNSLVQIAFSKYDLTAFEKTSIRPENYLEKKKNGYEGIGRYKEYEVFIGSPKLLN